MSAVPIWPGAMGLGRREDPLLVWCQGLLSRVGMPWVKRALALSLEGWMQTAGAAQSVPVTAQDTYTHALVLSSNIKGKTKNKTKPKTTSLCTISLLKSF